MFTLKSWRLGKDFGDPGFANYLLGDSAPPHPPGTYLPTLALRRDSCLKRTHPGSQCTLKLREIWVCEVLDPLTLTPHHAPKFHRVDEPWVGRTCPICGQLHTWQAPWRQSTAGLHIRCQALLKTFSSCWRPTEKARIFWEVLPLLCQLLTPSRNRRGGVLEGLEGRVWVFHPRAPMSD